MGKTTEMSVFSSQGVKVSSEHPTQTETQFKGKVIVFEPLENFDELGNNPAFSFWNDPGEDIYEK